MHIPRLYSLLNKHISFIFLLLNVKAISCFKDYTEIKTYLLGRDDISVADLKYVLGRIYEKKKDFKESLSFYMDCLKIRKEKLGEHEIVAETHHSIAVVEQIMNDYNAALERYVTAETDF